MQRNSNRSSTPSATSSRHATGQKMGRQLSRLLGNAYERKQFFAALHMRINWDKSVFLVHPALQQRLSTAELGSSAELSAVTQEHDTLYLFNVRVVADPQQPYGAVPELVVVPSPTRERKTHY